MTFNIVVCIKQVPDTTDIKWTEQNTIQREGLDSIVNPYDIGAILLAKSIKNFIPDTIITAVTMGPAQAKDALKEAIAMGCDEAYLLSDKKFSGADTLATAYTLSEFIKLKVPDFKLIICGQQAIDGDTAQTPSSLAEKLGIAQVTNIKELATVTDNFAELNKETDLYIQKLRLYYPALIACSLSNIEITPSINDYIKSQDKKITILDSASLNLSDEHTGIKGSPTRVKNAYRPVIERTVKLFDNQSVDECADFIMDKINNCKV